MTAKNRQNRADGYQEYSLQYLQVRNAAEAGQVMQNGIDGYGEKPGNCDPEGTGAYTENECFGIENTGDVFLSCA